jgi:3-dehydro-L-gulonate 2-dehydrogenase
MLRVPYSDLYDALLRATEHLGLTGDRAALCARLFAETTRDGVYTHGLNRFPRFAEMVRNGSVDLHAEPVRIANPSAAALAIERWDGRLGPGNLNAHTAMARAIALAREHGLGGVALANPNHWMRGGSYGWQAADAGVFGICWTNTLPNLPAWGTATPILGNNPLVIAIPRSETGHHVVLDMAMSQFSYGTLATYSARHDDLPVPGGYDSAGNLTRDPAAIEASQRALAIGYWKGSGLSLVLDMLAAMLSGGLAAHQLPRDPTRESGVSQVFLAINPSGFAARPQLDAIADAIVESLYTATPVDPDTPVRYPGEQTLHLRRQNLRFGVPVDPEIWAKLRALAF